MSIDYETFKTNMCSRIDAHLVKNGPIPKDLVDLLQTDRLVWAKRTRVLYIVKLYNRQRMQLETTRKWISERTSFGWFFSSLYFMSRAVDTQLSEHNESIDLIRDFILRVKVERIINKIKGAPVVLEAPVAS